MGYILLQDAVENSTKYYFSIFGMIFFGLGIIVGIYKLIKVNLILKINSDGIYHRKKFYKWEEILGTESTNLGYQNYFNIYLETYENSKGTILKDFQNLRKGNKILTIIDNENVDMIELENLTNSLIQNEPNNRQNLIFQSKIFKNNKNYWIYLLVLLLFLWLPTLNIIFFILTGLITFISVIILKWYRGEVTNSKIVQYSEMFALVGLLNIGILGIGVFGFKKITNSIGDKLTNQIEQYKKTHNQYPENLSQVKNDAELNIFENLLLNRISYQKTNNEYSLQLKKINSKIADYDNSTNEWQ
ncbi:hypothetical protein OBK20_13265 [Empedobacter falsenii]